MARITIILPETQIKALDTRNDRRKGVNNG